METKRAQGRSLQVPSIRRSQIRLLAEVGGLAESAAAPTFTMWRPDVARQLASGQDG
jgi:hypothetical protein